MNENRGIVTEYQIGATRIRISDACVVDPEEQARILKRGGLRRRGEDRRDTKEEKAALWSSTV